jgi:hypothetical protein
VVLLGRVFGFVNNDLHAWNSSFCIYCQSPRNHWFQFFKIKNQKQRTADSVISNTSNGPVVYMRKITKEFGSYLI